MGEGFLIAPLFYNKAISHLPELNFLSVMNFKKEKY